MRRAVVAGAGMAGLLAARALLGHADEVVVVEPDDLPDAPGTRPGTPHAEQFHILHALARGLLDHWFPDLAAELAAHGVVPLSTADGRMCVDGRMRPVIPDDELLPVHRPMVEWHVRRAVLPRVKLVRDRVVGLAGDRHRVSGVVLAGGRCDADLVVDASGRGTRQGEWLRGLGVTPAPKRRVHLDLGYATALYHRAPGQRLDGLLAVHSLRSAAWPDPGVSCVAAVSPDRWLCTVAGYGERRPGRAAEAFRERLLAEPAPAFAALVRTCAPATPVAVHRFPHSVRRDFHRADGQPEGLVSVGDAVASFNPVYGQGVPSAAMHVSAMSAWLTEGSSVEAYFERLRVLVDAAWQTSVVADFRLPHVRGERPRGHRVMQAVGAAIDRAAMADPVVARRFLDVVNMREHPRELLRPDILGRALRNEARLRLTR
ncbi:FAD-dependent oxidoreductase [Actinokineospora sp. UTMC 2448]|uniref:FAD-dependent oxidoreductase n=1 Tax=Actinokineospora sp. UTMC 2448 TaxID=2268449 RepID=UPI0021640BCC|nr:FAD-dependent oxidoreductase [Actinokineospora sp. UTMC 2448]UVS81591.1 Putative epoxidase LasC [Actinokineospora sp. UTMC 2448]